MTGVAVTRTDVTTAAALYAMVVAAAKTTGTVMTAVVTVTKATTVATTATCYIYSTLVLIVVFLAHSHVQSCFDHVCSYKTC